MQKNNLLVIGAILCASLLIGLDAQTAFAQISIQIITPTGGTLSSASDCTNSVRSDNVIWHNCNNVLYAIDGESYVVLASLAFTMTSVDRMLGSVFGNGVYIMTSQVSRYVYDVGTDTIVLNGVFSPSGCTLGNALEYDQQGFMWVTCSSEDIVIRFNPNTMTENFRSQDLTDGAGLECDLPSEIGYGVIDNIGVIQCNTTTNFVTFEIDNPTTLTLLDSEASASAVRVYVHPEQNRIILTRTASTALTYTYDANGIVTLENTFSSFGNDSCAPEYSGSEQKFIVCNDDSGTNTLINILLSNATDAYFISSQLIAFDDSGAMSVSVTNAEFVTFYLASGTNDQRIVIISGLRPITGLEPDPIGDGEEPNIVNGVNCDLPQNQGILLCIEDGGDGSIFPDGKNAADVGNDFGCLLTVIECTDGVPDDPNPQTNGIGLALTLLAELVAVAFLTIASRGQLVHIHPVAWALVFVGIVGISFMFGFIELQWFLLVVFFSIAFVAIKIVPTFTGLGGGSSA